MNDYRRLVALLTALPFAVFAVTGALTLTFGGAPTWLGLLLVGYSLAALALLWFRARWTAIVIRSAVPVLVVFAWYAQAQIAPMIVSATLSIVVALALTVARVQEETKTAIREREAVAQQLDRRMNELFTLQELSYVLSESLQLDHIVDQVARYARRFLQADGAMVVLMEVTGGRLRVVSAEGTLGSLRGRVLEEQGTLILRAIATERLEAATGDPSGSLTIEGITVRSAAAIPLRAHGVTMGALLVADRKFGAFTAEDFQLFSTVATHAAVVVANSRFFELIRRGKEEWETTFNALVEGIAVVGPDGTISRANLALAGLLGVSSTSLLGRPFAETAVGTAEPARQMVQEARDGNRIPPLIIRAESLGKVMRLTAAPVGGPGEDASVVILIEDVTEQRKLEAQLIQNEKLAAVGQLVSGVAHELNNPLTSIAGLSEFLVEHTRPNAREREHLQIIHEQAERAGRIVRDLLTFARKGGGHEKTRVDVNDLVTRTAALLNYDIKLRSIELALELDPAQPSVVGDRYELQQVVLNLLTNAVQAVGGMESGLQRSVRAATSTSAGSVTITIQDSGAGIPADLLPQLFTPFFTTKEPGRGTGLGLSISYGIVEAHGGRLGYNASPLGGAEFVITLPAFERTAEIEAPRPGVRTILLVDDDIAVHRVVSALFSTEGYQVDTARTGAQAFKLTAKREYDLIIAESRSVVEPGLLFVRALLSVQPGYKDRLIIATDITPLPTREGIPTLTKPFNLRELKSVASGILDQASIPQRSRASTG